MTLHELVAAMAEAERGPVPGDLEGAPRIDCWSFIADGNLLRAQGELTGHPIIRDPWVTTSFVLGYNSKLSWMRTRSRWYRIGEPFPPVSNEYEAAAQRLLAALRAQGRRALEQEGTVADTGPQEPVSGKSVSGHDRYPRR